MNAPLRQTSLRKRGTAIAGQMVIVVPLALTLAIGGSLVWGYMNVTRQTAMHNKAVGDLETAAISILKRVERLLVEKNDACGASSTRLKRFRDLGDGTVTDETFAATRVGGVIAAQPCIFDQAVDPTLSMVNVYNIKIERVGLPNIENSLSSAVQVTIELTPNTPSVKPALLSRQYVLQTASLGNYAVVLRSGGAGPRISATSAAGRLTIMGGTYVSDTAVVPISTLINVDATNVTFEGPVDVRAAQIGAGGDNLDTVTFANVFRGGVNAGKYGNTYNLPIANMTNWTVDFDYTHTYPLGSTDPNFVSLPYMAPFGALASMKSNSDPVEAYDPDGVYTTVPINGDGKHFMTRLSQTCGSEPLYVPVFVRMNPGQDFTINFPGITDTIFCGIIIARKVTIATNDGGTHGIYGHIIANRIEITGNGNVIIANPYDGKSIPGAPLSDAPGGTQSLANLQAQMAVLQSAQAYNFFLPIFRSDAAPPPTLTPQPPTTYMETRATDNCVANSCYIQGFKIDYAPIFPAGPGADPVAFTVSGR